MLRFFDFAMNFIQVFIAFVQLQHVDGAVALLDSNIKVVSPLVDQVEDVFDIENRGKVNSNAPSAIKSQVIDSSLSYLSCEWDNVTKTKSLAAVPLLPNQNQKTPNAG